MSIERSNSSRFCPRTNDLPNPELWARITLPDMDPHLGSRPQIQLKVVSVASITVMPLLNQWARLSRQVSSTACRVHCWVSTLMSFLPQWPLQHLLALRKLATREEVFSSNLISPCTATKHVVSSAIGSYHLLCWASKDNGNSPCCFRSLWEHVGS